MPAEPEEHNETAPGGADGNDFAHNDLRRMAELRVNPVLDAMNNAFAEFTRVVVCSR